MSWGRGEYAQICVRFGRVCVMSCPCQRVNYYNDALSSCFDIIAPIKSKVTSLTRSAPWYTDQLRHLKRHGRQLERLAKKTGLTVHLDAFKLHQQQYIDALNTARSSHYSSITQSGSNNPRTLFSTDQLRHLKRHGRQLERLAKKTGLTVHLDAFK